MGYKALSLGQLVVILILGYSLVESQNQLESAKATIKRNTAAIQDITESTLKLKADIDEFTERSLTQHRKAEKSLKACVGSLGRLIESAELAEQNRRRTDNED